jgi:hypothetical protein
MTGKLFGLCTSTVNIFMWVSVVIFQSVPFNLYLVEFPFVLPGTMHTIKVIPVDHCCYRYKRLARAIHHFFCHNLFQRTATKCHDESQTHYHVQSLRAKIPERILPQGKYTGHRGHDADNSVVVTTELPSSCQLRPRGGTM